MVGQLLRKKISVNSWKSTSLLNSDQLHKTIFSNFLITHKFIWSFIIFKIQVTFSTEPLVIVFLNQKKENNLVEIPTGLFKHNQINLSLSKKPFFSEKG